MLIVDTNVLVDVAEKDPQWAEWSTRLLDAQAALQELAINPVIYAELSVTFAAVASLDGWLEEAKIKVVEIPRQALFLAGRAFVQYRRKGGDKHNVLPDFFIGAHAAVSKSPILTRDAARYRTYFPTVDLLTP